MDINITINKMDGSLLQDILLDKISSITDLITTYGADSDYVADLLMKIIDQIQAQSK